MLIDLNGNALGEQMTQPSTDLRFDVAMQRGDVRSAMGWAFVHRLEKLVNELLAKHDCPEIFWVVYTAKWDDVERKIKELWQVTDEEPNQMMGQVVYKIWKDGKAECCALPFDIPVPEEELSDELVLENAQFAANMPLSDHIFEKIN